MERTSHRHANKFFPWTRLPQDKTPRSCIGNSSMTVPGRGRNRCGRVPGFRIFFCVGRCFTSVRKQKRIQNTTMVSGSPSFPFFPLRRNVEKTEQMTQHNRELIKSGEGARRAFGRRTIPEDGSTGRGGKGGGASERKKQGRRIKEGEKTGKGISDGGEKKISRVCCWLRRRSLFQTEV